MVKFQKCAFVALGLSFLTSSISAELIIDNTEERTSFVKDNVELEKNAFKELGKRVNYKPIKGFANDLPLYTVLEQILPNGWKMSKNGDIDLQQLVSWKGGKSWDRILRDVSKDRFSTVVDWNKKEVLITTESLPKTKVASTKRVSQPAPARASQPSVQPVQRYVDTGQRPNGAFQSSFTASSVSNQPQQVTTAARPQTKATTRKSSQVKSKVKSWTLSKNYTLKENITNWGKREGWTVVWKAPDYKILADAKLVGEIDSEDGPVISILKLYEDSSLPLKVSILGGNKVISVEGKNYYTNGVDIQ